MWDIGAAKTNNYDTNNHDTKLTVISISSTVISAKAEIHIPENIILTVEIK
jgi:hypothetical protein